MKSSAVFFFAALATLTAARSLRSDAHKWVKEAIHKIHEGEEKCRQDNGLSREQVLKSGCKMPSDPELQERVRKYSLCYMLNYGQMLPNGSFVFTPFVNCSADALAVTDPPPTAAAAPPHPSHLTHADNVRLCEMQGIMYDCQQEIGARRGASPEQKAMDYRLCMCNGFLSQIRNSVLHSNVGPPINHNSITPTAHTKE